MKCLKSFMTMLLFMTGTLSSIAGSLYDYETIDGVKYLCLHSTYHAYIVSLPPISHTQVTIPQTIQHYQNYVLKNYDVVGFEKGIVVAGWLGKSYYEPAARQKEHFVRAVDILQDLQQRTLGSDRPNMQRLVKALRAQHFEYGAYDGQRGWYAVKRE